MSDTIEVPGAADEVRDAADEVTPIEDRRIWLHGKGVRTEIRSRSLRLATITAWVTAAILLIGGTFWAINAWQLLDPCERTGVGSGVGCLAPTSVLRTTQFVVALAGLAAAAVAVIYVLHLAITGRTFRRWRGVAATFGGLVIVWLAVYVVGALSI